MVTDKACTPVASENCGSFDYSRDRAQPPQHTKSRRAGDPGRWRGGNTFAAFAQDDELIARTQDRMGECGG